LKLSISSTPIERPQAVLFDLDGTLIDSRLDIAAACNHALEAVGREPLPVNTIARFVGDGARMLVARALGELADAPLVDRALAAFHPYYEAHPAEHTRVLPGVTELLDALGDRPLGICTNKPRGATMACLDALGLTSRFVSIRAGGDGPLKPDPAAVTAALASMRVDARHTWMVGDGEQDILAGRGAGCLTVGVRGGFQADERLEAAKPDFLLGSIADLIALVRVPQS
jgi:phosphoglycolate phosphatase